MRIVSVFHVFSICIQCVCVKFMNNGFPKFNSIQMKMDNGNIQFFFIGIVSLSLSLAVCVCDNTLCLRVHRATLLAPLFVIQYSVQCFFYFLCDVVHSPVVHFVLQQMSHFPCPFFFIWLNLILSVDFHSNIETELVRFYPLRSYFVRCSFFFRRWKKKMSF